MESGEVGVPPNRVCYDGLGALAWLNTESNHAATD
jgi:hypothetical protein